MNKGVIWLIGAIIGISVLLFFGAMLVGWFFISTAKPTIVYEGTTIQEGESITIETSTQDLDWGSVEPIDFNELKNNPDNYKSEKVVYEGVIVQVIEDGNYTDMHVAIDGDYDSILYVKHLGLTDFVEDDTVTIYGTVIGSYSDNSSSDHNGSLPAVIAYSIE